MDALVLPGLALAVVVLIAVSSVAVYRRKRVGEQANSGREGQRQGKPSRH